jgi:hypothetical protein
MDNNDDFSFSDYYGAMVEHLGESALRRLLPLDKTPSEWSALLAEDQHLNNVSLHLWDQRDGYVRGLVRNTEELRAINGTGGWSLSDSVCVLKETARRYALESETSNA